MKISEVRIENFRSYRSETILLDNYTALVGPNGGGKSNILTALNILFRNTKIASTDVNNLEEEDFHRRNIDSPIIITVTFDDLSDPAQEDFKEYYRNGKLVISAKATWNREEKRAEVKQVGSRYIMEPFSIFFEEDKKGAKVIDLRSIYNEIRINFGELPAETTKGAMTEALKSYESRHPELCTLKESSDQFYGWSRGNNKLAKYIQWVYIPAVKEASTEQEESKNSALGQLLERTIREKVNFLELLKPLRDNLERDYKKILDQEEGVLSTLSDKLRRRIQEYAHPGIKLELKWDYTADRDLKLNEPVAKAILGEHEFLGGVTKLGHGVQRAFIMALLQEMASVEEQSEPRLILGIEEPELYQHPPQARHISEVLLSLASKNAQIILTSHSPLFVSSRQFGNIRMVRKDQFRHSKVSSYSHEELSKQYSEIKGSPLLKPTATMAKAMNIMMPTQNELFFTPFAVIVEGPEDQGYISSYMLCNRLWDEFRTAGCHFVLAQGKDNLPWLSAIAKGFDIPLFVVFDGDNDKYSKEPERQANTIKNQAILRFCGHEIQDVSQTVWKDNVVMWSTCIHNDVQDSIPPNIWREAQDEAKREHGLEFGVNEKNCVLVAATVEKLIQKEVKIPTLEKLCASIITRAKNFV